MEPITLQELVDLNYRHFIINDDPFGFDTDAGSCVYRGDDGLKCAIGVALGTEFSDEALDTSMSLEYLYGTDLQPLLESRFKDINYLKLDGLQNKHDSFAHAVGSGAMSEAYAKLAYAEFLSRYAKKYDLLDPARQRQ